MRGAAKREQLIDRAAELFNRHGYRGTGVDLIIAETGISKATLYRYFNTKEELIVAVLAKLDEEAREEMRAFVDKASSDPRERLLATFGQLDLWLRDGTFYGCPFMSAASEFGAGPNIVLQQVQLHKRLHLAYFEEMARAARVADARTVARQIVMLHEGAIAFAQVLGPKGAAATARLAAEAIIDGALRAGKPATTLEPSGPKPAAP